MAAELAAFVVRAFSGDLSEAARPRLKLRVVDSLSCAIGALIRRLDFKDSYLATRASCHPSDDLGAVLAAASANQGGRDLLTALAPLETIAQRRELTARLAQLLREMPASLVAILIYLIQGKDRKRLARPPRGP